MTDWIDLDLRASVDEYAVLIDEALALKSRSRAERRELLRDQVVFFLFFNQSLRTRSSFQVGVETMGGHAVQLEPGRGIYTPALPGHEVAYSTERVSDVAQVLSEYGDAIAIRMYGEPVGWVYGAANATLREFARHAKVPVLNMECDRFHPCQALADMLTLRERLGDLRGRKLTVSWAYSASWHKPAAVPQSALLAASKCGLEITVAHPEGFDLDPEVMAAARGFAAQSGGAIEVTNDFESGLSDADAVYAKSWCSLKELPRGRGDAVDEAAMERLLEANRDWIVDEEAMATAGPEALYLHCLPADRGQEVTDSVIDGPRSVVFQQAANRLHAQNAMMVRALGEPRP
jgi:N-acetylornithine carbamoyltransferase